jgi:ABC-type transport system involved in Fe-S cluster assembly fused permease/ATPase subunit
MSMMTFSHLLNLSLSFQVKKKTGEVLRTLDRGSAINSFFQTLLFQLAPIAVDIVIAIVYFWALFGVGLAILVAIIMSAYVTASIVLTKLRVKLRRDMNDKDKYTRGILADALGAWETIKLFGGETREMNRYGNALKAYQKSEFKVIASLNFLNLLQNGIISLGLLVGALIVAFSVVVQRTR